MSAALSTAFADSLSTCSNAGEFVVMGLVLGLMVSAVVVVAAAIATNRKGDDGTYDGDRP